MSTITTFSNISFDPMSPDTNDILVEDIAHALSLLCRAGGHFKSFYSVAQHSLNCMNEAKERGYSKNLQLACLLHDGSEAYLADITRPVKKHLQGYREIECNLQSIIYEKWLFSPLLAHEHEQLHNVDDTLLQHEFLHFMGKLGGDMPQTPQPLLSTPQFNFLPFEEVEHRFLHAFNSFFNT